MIFLGGTCGKNRWREEIVIPQLLARGVAPEQLYNPVVEHWTPEVQQREDELKRTADILLFVIASPDPSTPDIRAVSGYSLVELTMCLYDAPHRTVALFDTTGMERRTAKGINKIEADLRQRFPDAPIFAEYSELIDWLLVRHKGVK